MSKVNVIQVRDVPDQPGFRQGSCSCGESGPATTNEFHAEMWGVAHEDSHGARKI